MSNFYSIDKTKVDISNLKCNQKAFDVCKYTLLPELLNPHSKRPDLYIRNKTINGNDYRYRETVNNEMKTAVSSPISEHDNIHIDEKELNLHSAYDELKNERRRYFTKDNITIKCYNCSQVGHFSRNCPIGKVIRCLRCYEVGHEEYECRQVKCFKCNQLGHKAYECKMPKERIFQCNRCNNFGHISSDCLIEPKGINYNNKYFHQIKCEFCNCTGHFICPFKTDNYQVEDYDTDDVEISDEDSDNEDKKEGDGQYLYDDSLYDDSSDIYSNEDEDDEDEDEKGKNNSLGMKRSREQIFADVPNARIHKTIFCYKCGDMHSSRDCQEKIRENVFDLRRQQYSMKKTSNNQNNKQKDNYNDNSYSKGRNSNNKENPEYKRKHLTSSFKEKNKYKYNNNNNNHQQDKNRNKREDNQLMFNRFK